ncbi:MAG TPA: ATP-binding cassette domain-containing protein, partial [Acidimicrobiales bacterium]|nr:ATP-binding cassette domain-containing protein [Acidimicrobiales bacterium]
MSLGTDAADAVAADAASTSASRGAADRLHPVARSLGPALLILLAQVVVFPAPGAIMLRGLIVGGLTALVALGMALVYRANRIVNFAQADLGFAPTVVAYLLLTESGVPYPVAVGIGLALAVATGALTERFVIRRFANSPRLLVTIATIGLSQLLAAVALLAPRLWDVQLIAGRVDPPFDLTRRVGSLTFDANDFLALVATPIAVALIGAFLRGSDAGVAIRASADSAARASLLGVPVARLQTLVWSVAAALAFVAVFLRSGILELPSGTALGFSILFRALAALLLGRMTDLVGVTSAALALGVLELGVEWNHGFELIDPVLGLVIVVALVVRRRESAGMARADVSAWHAGEAVRPVPAALAALPVVKAARWGALGLVAVVAVVLPHLLPADDVFRASAVLIYAILGVSLVLLSGWAGTVSLGQVAFFAIGAAVAGAAIVSWDVDLFPALVLASVVGALAAVIVGIPTLRLRGLYLAVTTFALALATTSYLLNDDYFGWVPSDERVVRPPFLGGIEASSEVQVYYLALIVLALVMLGMKGVRSGRFGRALVALRDNERAAQAYAVDPARTQLAAFALSGAIAALAGGLFVHHEQAFDSTSYSPIENLAVFTMVVLGGMGSLAGAVLGALFLLGGRWFLDTDWQFVASGLGVLAILLAAPSGLAGLLYRARDAWLRTVARGRGLDVPAYSTSSTDITPPSFAGPDPASPSPPSVAGSAPVSPSPPSVAGSAPASPSSPSFAGSAPASPTPATVPDADAAIGLGPEGSASPSTDPAEAAPPVDGPTGRTPVVAASLGAGSDRPEGEAAEAGAQGVDVSLPAANGSRGGSNGAAGEWLLDVRDVEAGYGGVPVLFGVDLAVRAGEAVALLGTNGAGKSTLLNAISGLAPPTAGRVLVGGDDLTGCPAHVVAAHGVAQMPGGKGTFPTLTVAENMRVASWLRRGDRDGLAADVDRLQELFPMLRKRASQPAGSLSGGQQQMLALAMSVLTKPRLLMIDELSLGLAPVVVGDLLQFV